MLKLVQLSLFSFGLCLAIGCGSGTPTPPSQEEIDRNAAAMESDLKNMMNQVPQKPK